MSDTYYLLSSRQPRTSTGSGSNQQPLHARTPSKISHKNLAATHTLIVTAVYKNIGSWRFILIQSILVAIWVILNATAYIRAWDPYPFIFMNLIFSLQSAYTASLIMMSQNRQDKLKAHNDYLMNLRTEEETRAVLEHLAAQEEAFEDIYQELLKIRKDLQSHGS